MSIKLVVFDFDGTLVHTAPDIIAATNDFLQLHGREPLSDEEIVIHIGNGLIGLIRGVVPEAAHHPQIASEVEAQFSKIYDAHVLKRAQPFDGVREFLDAWPHKVAILSNKAERYIHQLLKHLNLDRYPWSSIVGGDTYSERKPHPLPLQMVMKEAHCSPHETLMVGDGPPDVGVALACQTHLLAVGYGYSPLEELKSLGAEHSVGSFLELPQAIGFLESYTRR